MNGMVLEDEVMKAVMPQAQGEISSPILDEHADYDADPFRQGKPATYMLHGKHRTAQQKATMDKLDKHYRHLHQVLIRYRSYTTGLFPRYSLNKVEGYVRDSIYCAMACWACGTAYERLDDDRGRAYELGQSTVKTMRGILMCWMRQIDNLEQFKKTQNYKFCLHSKFDLRTGDTLPEKAHLGEKDHYGHLQVDVVALYLLVLVQMITSGLEIVFTQHEVNFVQNLVFYIERAYRIPDFGMWERGSRYNDGHPELHASSVGFVKAALEAINGFNVFGYKGTASSVIYVDIDAHNRNRTTFETLLPRESNSKNTDAALLPTCTFPCFATHDHPILFKTMDKLERKLKMKHGYKRHLRDGFRTVVEDRSKPLYTLAETTKFQDIECQWPLFYVYMTLYYYFRGDCEKNMNKMWHKVNDTLVPSSLDEHRVRRDSNVRLLYEDHGPVMIVPECYYVPAMSVAAERSNPGTQLLLPANEEDDGMFLWGQALYSITALLIENLLHSSDIDPIYRHLPASQRPKTQHRHSVFQGSLTNNPVVQVALIAENAELSSLLLTYGIRTQTAHQVEPVSIWPSQRLVQVFNSLGKNDSLKLSGRPPRPIGTLGTCKIYRVFGETVLCYPLLFDVSDFYIAADPTVLIDDIKEGLAFVANRWKLAGRPTFCIILRQENIRGAHFKAMLELLRGLMDGCVDNVRVRASRVQNLLSASCVEHLDFADPAMLDSISVEALSDVTGRPRLKSLLDTANHDTCLVDTETKFDIKDHLKLPDSELERMLRETPSTSLKKLSLILAALCDRKGFDYRLLGQSMTIRQNMEAIYRESGIWKNWTVVRFCAGRLRKVVDSLAPSITSLLVRGKQITFGLRGHEEVHIRKPLTPQQIESMLFRVIPMENISAAVIQQELTLALAHMIENEPQLFQGIITVKLGWLMEALETMLNFDIKSKRFHELGEAGQRVLTAVSPTELKKLLHDLLARKHWGQMSPLQQRRLNGALNRTPVNFHDEVWKILERTPDGIEISGKHLPQQPTLSEMTQFELNFALAVEELLGRIQHPEYRQILVELMIVVATILSRNPELNFSGVVVMEQLLEDAFLMFAEEANIKDLKDMTPFYQLEGNAMGSKVTTYLAKAVINKLLGGSRRHKTETRHLDTSHCTLM